MQRNGKAKVLISSLIARYFAAVAMILASAQASPATAGTESVSAWPTALRQLLQRVSDVEWRLAAAAGTLCPSQASVTGLTYDDLDAYETKDRTLLAQDLGMTQRPQVAAVAAGSPAERAGILPGDTILSIGGVETDQIRAKAGSKQLMADKLHAFTAKMPAGQPIAFELVRDGARIKLTVTPVQRCSARIMLKTDPGKDAYSDADNIALTAGLTAAARNDDELALVVAHELGHILARDASPRGKGQRTDPRKVEDRADALGFDLAACAGYDPMLGLDLWRRTGKKDLLRWFRLPTHRSFAKRIKLLSARASPSTCPLTAVPPLAP